MVDAINRAHDLLGSLPFGARLDPLDRGVLSGQGLISKTPVGQWAATTAGGSGEEFDQASGLSIENGGRTHVIRFAGAATVEDLLNTINTSGAGLLAAINRAGTGLDLRSRSSGADFAIGENGGTTATQLGLRTFTGAVRLADLNFGRGVAEDLNAGRKSSVAFTFAGANNDLRVRARRAGPEWDGFAVDFVDGGVPPGGETVAYDPVGKTITFNIAPGSTTAARIVELAAAVPGLSDDFEVVLDPHDGSPNNGSGLVAVAPVATTAGGVTAGADFTIVRADGVELDIDIDGAASIQDVLDRINNHPLNPPRAPGDPPWLVARLSARGNGIELVDESVGTGPTIVRRVAGSLTAVDLGLVPAGQSQTVASGHVVTGRDVNLLETEGLFTALIRLKTALDDNNLDEIRRSIDTLDAQMLRTNLARAELGAKQRGLDILKNRLDTEDVELRSALSDEHDADLAEVVSNLSARQAALTAALQAAAEVARLTLLDYL